MFHLRTPESTHQRPLTWCGARPEVSEKYLQGPHYLLTEWEWVQATAVDHPDDLCQICVECVSRVHRHQTEPPTDTNVSPF